MGRPVRQTGDEPRVDGPHGQLASFRAAPELSVAVEDPVDLRPGEVGVEEKTGAGPDVILMALGFQSSAEVGRSSILPDDGPMDRLQRLPVPQDHRLPLAGDAGAGSSD